MIARQIPELVPGSPEWLKVMTASKVSAVLGISPWTSPYTLWQLMAGREDPEPQTKDQARGHYLEPAIAHWFQDQHPDWAVSYPGGTWVSIQRPWMVANPDGLVREDALLEIKTDAGNDDWGRPGTDQVPVWYRAQAQWAMDITGRSVTYFALLTSYLDFKEYVVEYDADDAEFARDRAAAFLASIEVGEPPAIDGHASTYQSVRKLHPAIDGSEIQVPGDVAQEFIAAVIDLEDAEQRAALAKTELLAATGTAKRAVYGNQHIATRKARNGGTPWIEPARGLAKQMRGIAS
ncbi:MAG TPA: YqaJ viral recombinase family protein [Mycobacterium sp.]|jgi:putative phage-type endonuclease|uniref:YqaJ viral recombinase family nuclease n=1 Tax=Mycobacterium sp. TaxID=1785 RepID=UPI002F3E806A